MERLRDQYTVRLMARVLGVSRSGFYAWQQRPPSARAQAEVGLLQTIRAIFQRSRGTYGAPRIHATLRQGGSVVGRHRVARLMRRAALSGRLRRRYRYTSVLPRRLLTIPNRLARQFAPQAYRRDQAWAADLTYLRTAEGWLHLAVLLDLASRRVVGWATAATLEHTLPIAALRQALYRRQPARGLLHHSDRGFQYTSHDYQQLLAAAGATLSYSRPANCWDNAVVESFFATLKTELRVGTTRWRTRADARAAIVTYLDWYNAERLHSALHYRSPRQYEEEVFSLAS